MLFRSSFMSAVITDYSGTYYKSFKTIPATNSEMLTFWLNEQANEDIPRQLLEGQTLPILILEAREFTERLEEHRSRDLDVLEADLVAAIDDFRWHTAQAIQLLALAEQNPRHDREDAEDTALATVVEGAKKFAVAFAHYNSNWMKVRNISKEAALVHSRRVGEAHQEKS